MDGDKYDPNLIIQSANDKLAAGDLEGGQMVFQSALLTWVDDAREGGGGYDPESLREAIATLWLAYAQFLAGAKQFKSATEAYEQAVACPVAGGVGRVWLEYARFAEDRGKLKTAQSVYLRALAGDHPPVDDEQDQCLLWNEFLEMMRKNNPELTLEELQSAIQAEHGPSGPKADAPEPVSYVSSPSQAPAAKRPRLESPAAPPPLEPAKTHVVTAEPVELEASAFGEILNQKSLPGEISAAWMIRDGNGPAQPPEPPLFEPSPPKLSDPTAKDLLGTELALELLRRLLAPSGNLLLEVCRGLWTLQALKEKEAKDAIDMFDKKMVAETERMEANLDARLSVAGPALAAVEQMNQNDRLTFQSGCSQQRQNVLSGIAWEFRRLLCIQQQILTKLKVPGFDGPTVDAAALAIQSKVCSFLHSAFYLRSRIKEAPHLSMLKSQVARLEKEIESGQATSPPPSGRLSPHEMPRNVPLYSQQQYQQQPYGYGQPTPPPHGMLPSYGYHQGPPPPMPPQNQSPYGNQQYPYYQ